MAVNQRPALRQPPKSPNSRIGKGARHEQTEERVKKNQRERERRDDERFHVGRISYLFRVADPDRSWTRLEVLCFGKLSPLHLWIRVIAHENRSSRSVPPLRSRGLLSRLHRGCVWIMEFVNNTDLYPFLITYSNRAVPL